MSQALPEEALQKILAQMQGTLVNSQRQLSLVKAQVQAKDKEATMLGLTSKELDDQSKDGDISFYKGVGKMFMMESKTDIQKDLAGKEKMMKDDISNLMKKQKFLEKQFSEAQGHMRDLFQGMDNQRQAQAQAQA